MKTGDKIFIKPSEEYNFKIYSGMTGTLLRRSNYSNLYEDVMWVVEIDRKKAWLNRIDEANKVSTPFIPESLMVDRMAGLVMDTE